MELQVGREPLTATIDSFTVSAQAQEGRILPALQVLPTGLQTYRKADQVIGRFDWRASQIDW